MNALHHTSAKSIKVEHNTQNEIPSAIVTTPGIDYDKLPAPPTPPKIRKKPLPPIPQLKHKPLPPTPPRRNNAVTHPNIRNKNQNNTNCHTITRNSSIPTFGYVVNRFVVE